MKKNFILIHGAWHGGWCWKNVSAELEKAGNKVQTPTMPGHHPKDDRQCICLEDYITRIVSTIEKTQGPVVLVGHSSAGFLIQSAAARVPERIDHLIFNNAFILPHGNCQFDMVPREVAQAMTAAAKTSPDNCVPVMEAFVRNTLMSDTPKAIQEELIAHLVPQPLALFTTPVDLTGFDRGIFRKNLLFCTRDQSLPEGAYQGMARALDPMDIIKLDLGHEGLFTHPEQIAAGLMQAINNT